MNLNNFESSIEPKIIDRGIDYFKNGYIESLELEDDTWFAKVSGSDDYCVEVSLSDDGEILSSYCDCPYDFGDYCKHQVAVFYALRELPKQQLKSQNNSKVNLNKILMAQSVDVLAAILTEYAENNKRIKSDLLLRFSDADNLVERARDLIKNTVKKAMRRGFIEYGHTTQAIEGAEKVLDMIEILDSAINRIKLLIIVLEEMMNLYNCCDDSHGDVGGVITSAVNKFNTIISEFSRTQTEKVDIFTLVVNHASSHIYNG